MNTKIKYILVALVALVLPLGIANAQVNLYFGTTNNTVGGSVGTLNLAAGSTFTLSLDLTAAGAQKVDALDYWLTQFSGPSAGAFSIVSPGRDYTGSNWPDPSSSNATITATTDGQKNNANGTGADGVPDNQINPQNGFNLGSTATTGDLGSGHVTTFTLQISPTATAGTYDLRTFDYAGRGWSDTVNNTFDQAFASQAEIQVNVTSVPEPATWSMLGLGGLGTFGLNFLRARRRRS